MLVRASSRLAVRRMVGAEQEDVRPRRDQQRVLFREDGRGSRRETLVRRGDSARHGEIAGNRPDHEQNEERNERHPRPALPRPPRLRPAHEVLPTVATTAAVGRAFLLRARIALAIRQRHLSLRATALVYAVRLFPGGGHSAGYGTRWA